MILNTNIAHQSQDMNTTTDFTSVCQQVHHSNSNVGPTCIRWVMREGGKVTWDPLQYSILFSNAPPGVCDTHLA